MDGLYNYIYEKVFSDPVNLELFESIAMNGYTSQEERDYMKLLKFYKFCRDERDFNRLKLSDRYFLFRYRRRLLLEEFQNFDSFKEVYLNVRRIELPFEIVKQYGHQVRTVKGEYIDVPGFSVNEIQDMFVPGNCFGFELGFDTAYITLKPLSKLNNYKDQGSNYTLRYLGNTFRYPLYVMPETIIRISGEEVKLLEYLKRVYFQLNYYRACELIKRINFGIYLCDSSLVCEVLKL